MKHLVACFTLSSGLALAGGEEVRLPGTGLELVGRFYPAPAGKAPAPAVVMLHGCSGMWARNGEPTRSYERWAEHLRKLGFAALLLDSFGPRGEREICTQAERRIHPDRERVEDAYAALRWLAARPGIDPDSIHLLGWSNGAMTVLHAMNEDAPGRGALGPRFRSAMALYPGCNALTRTQWRPTAPLLIQAGGADDWTPARYCESLALRARDSGAQVEIDVYEGAHHGFDRIDGKVRVRPEVRNPSSPTGWGATVGPHPEARRKAFERVTAFLESQR